MPIRVSATAAAVLIWLCLCANNIADEFFVTTLTSTSTVVVTKNVTTLVDAICVSYVNATAICHRRKKRYDLLDTSIHPSRAVRVEETKRPDEHWPIKRPLQVDRSLESSRDLSSHRKIDGHWAHQLLGLLRSLFRAPITTCVTVTKTWTRTITIRSTTGAQRAIVQSCIIPDGWGFSLLLPPCPSTTTTHLSPGPTTATLSTSDYPGSSTFTAVPTTVTSPSTSAPITTPIAPNSNVTTAPIPTTTSAHADTTPTTTTASPEPKTSDIS